MCLTQTFFKGANRGLQGLSAGLNVVARAASRVLFQTAPQSRTFALPDMYKISAMHKKSSFCVDWRKIQQLGDRSGWLEFHADFSMSSARKSIILVLRNVWLQILSIQNVHKSVRFECAGRKRYAKTNKLGYNYLHRPLRLNAFLHLH